MLVHYTMSEQDISILAATLHAVLSQTCLTHRQALKEGAPRTLRSLKTKSWISAATSTPVGPPPQMTNDSSFLRSSSGVCRPAGRPTATNRTMDLSNQF
jgi:hypothetical protein